MNARHSIYQRSRSESLAGTDGLFPRWASQRRAEKLAEGYLNMRLRCGVGGNFRRQIGGFQDKKPKSTARGTRYAVRGTLSGNPGISITYCRQPIFSMRMSATQDPGTIDKLAS